MAQDLFFGIVGGALVIIVLAVVLLAFAILAFEVWMFLDVLRNQKISDTTRIIWVLGMLLLHPVIAVVYYFTDRRKTL